MYSESVWAVITDHGLFSYEHFLPWSFGHYESYQQNNNDEKLNSNVPISDIIRWRNVSSTVISCDKKCHRFWTESQRNLEFGIPIPHDCHLSSHGHFWFSILFSFIDLFLLVKPHKKHKSNSYTEQTQTWPSTKYIKWSFIKIGQNLAKHYHEQTHASFTIAKHLTMGTYLLLWL